MKGFWTFVLVVAAFGGFQAATHRTSGSAAVAGKELRVEIKWPGSKGAIEAPLELADEIPVVRCRINGKEAVLYADTGSHAISLYEDRLARFGLKVTSEEDWPQYTTGGLVTRTRFCNEFLLAFKDGLTLEVSGAACVPAAGRSPGHEVDGLLGVRIMRALNGVIDLGASKVIFTVKAAPKSGSTNGSPPIGSETNRTSSPVGSRDVYVEIPEVFELANVAIAISEEGLKHPYRVDKTGAYYQRVLKHFLPFKNHPLIENPDLHRNYTYFFRDNSYCYVFDGDRIVHGGVYPPMRRPDLFTRHRAAVEDFAKVSSFRAFYRDHLPHYREQIRQYEKKVPLRQMGEWLEQRFPARSHRYRVVFSPLLGSSHETCGFETNGIQESIMFVCGPGEPVEVEDPVADARLARTVFTEIDHNYVNPITELFLPRVRAAFANFDKWSGSDNRDSYPAAEMTFNEYMTWAVFLLYARDTYDPKTFAAVKQQVAKQMVQGRSFPRFPEFTDELLRLYGNRIEGISITNLYPPILDWAEKCRDNK